MAFEAFYVVSNGYDGVEMAGHLPVTKHLVKGFK